MGFLRLFAAIFCPRAMSCLKILGLLALIPALMGPLPVDQVNLEVRGNFNIIRTIGQGAQGICYLAEKTDKPGTFVVLKTFETHPNLPAIRAAMLIDEWFDRSLELNEMMRGISSRAILKYENDVANFDGLNVKVQVSDYLEGSDLRKLLFEGNISPANSLELGAQFARDSGEALASLFSLGKNGIVHRDVKPANFMVTADGVVLLDHGLTSDSVKRSDVAGSPAYMSPEHIREQGFASDLWARALILGEIVTGTQFILEYTGFGMPVESLYALLNKMSYNERAYQGFFNSVTDGLNEKEQYWKSQGDQNSLEEFLRLRKIIEAGLSQTAQGRVTETIATDPTSLLSKTLKSRSSTSPGSARACRKTLETSSQSVIDNLDRIFADGSVF